MMSSTSSAVRRLLARMRNVNFAFLFGSEARGKAGKASDVDIGLFLARPLAPEKRLALRLDLADKLSGLTGREADVVILNSAGSFLKYQVARDGKLLFERKRGAAKQFRLNAIKEYFDYLPTFNFHFNRQKKRRTA